MLVSRRTFFFGSLALPAFAGKKPEPLRPGVLLILVDQLPAFMLGAYGNRQVRTPNLDRLAQMGTVFANHFACAPSPIPGRNTLLTGRTPMQLGPAGTLSADDVPLAKILGAAGYTCQEGDIAAANQFLDGQTAGKPFFFTLNCPSLRGPYDHVAQKYMSLYTIEPFLGYAPDLPATNAAAGKEMLGSILGNVRRVAAALTELDDSIGTVLTKLKAKGLRDNTLVIFSSCSGALWGRHGLWGGVDGSDPLNMFDASVATPMFWSWPGHIPAVAKRPEEVSAYDLVPSVCTLLGVETPKRNLCGRSYALEVTGQSLPKKSKRRLAIFAHQGNTDMAREDRYKLIQRNDGKGPNELYDMVTDADERANQADNQQFMTIEHELTAELENWKKQYSS